MSESKRIVSLYTESNPNPSTLKFVANYYLIKEGSFEFTNHEDAKHSPLAELLFNFPFVSGVFISSNFVTVTKNDETEWYEVQNEIKEVIKNFLQSGERIILESVVDLVLKEESVNNNQEDLTLNHLVVNSDLINKIESILEEYVKPAVEQDGGAITFDSFDNGVVRVKLQGACSGCPSSSVTLKQGIENLMVKMIPEVTSVEAING